MPFTPSRRSVTSWTRASFSAVGMASSGPRALGLDRYEHGLGIDRDPRAHGGAQGDGLEIGALGGRRLGAHQLAEKGHRVLVELILGERRLADRRMHVRALVHAVLDLAAFDLLDGLGHVEG